MHIVLTDVIHMHKTPSSVYDAPRYASGQLITASTSGTKVGLQISNKHKRHVSEQQFYGARFSMFWCV